MTYQGGTIKDKFIDYLKNVLADTLHDNLDMEKIDKILK